MANATKVDPALENLQGLLNTLKFSAQSAADLVDAARAAGAADIASVLANLETDPATPGGDPSTKLVQLQQNLRDAVEAAHKVAEVIGAA